MNRESQEKHLFEKMTAELSSSLIADALDTIGISGQCMRHDLSPIFPEAKVVGRVYPILYANLGDSSSIKCLGMREIIDTEVPPNSVLAIGCNQSRKASIWAEMMSIGARNRGIRGVIADGLVRDVTEMREMAYPVFCTGYTPLAAINRMNVVDHGRFVNCGDILVQIGDIAFGDADGIVVIPSGHEEQVIEVAFKAAEKENRFREQLLAGGVLQDLNG
jgi:4-hydroxy-4-methyl-2-oxoglutarate aldolase